MTYLKFSIAFLFYISDAKKNLYHAVLFLKCSFATIKVFFLYHFCCRRNSIFVLPLPHQLDYWAYSYCNLILQRFYRAVYKTCAFLKNVYSIDILPIFVFVLGEYGGLSQIMINIFFFSLIFIIFIYWIVSIYQFFVFVTLFLNTSSGNNVFE